eukprot:11740940-Alexandrium_andersonii.AAC.1
MSASLVGSEMCIRDSRAPRTRTGGFPDQLVGQSGHGQSVGAACGTARNGWRGAACGTARTERQK